MAKAGHRFRDLSKGKRIAIIAGSAIAYMMTIWVFVAVAASPSSTTPPPQTPTAVVETKTVDEKSSIDFSITTKDDATLAKGQTRVEQEGVAGERTTTYEVTYTDGQETGRKEVSSTVTREPVNKVVVNGTYVYVAPTPAPEPVQRSSSGARTGAVCNDGSTSTATGRGACSHHDGVDYWTY